MQWAEIGAKRVTYEDGSVRTVPPFVVSVDPISTSDYVEFTRRSGYKTLAEIEGDEDTVHRNYVLDELPARLRGKAAAMCLCHRDAEAFAVWHGWRLPSEDEWIAAATIDERVLTEADFVRLWKELEAKKVVNLRGGDFTSTRDGPHVVVRSGPALAQVAGRTHRHHRHLVSETFRDVATEFRVCRS